MEAKALIHFVGLVTFTTQLLPLDSNSTRLSGTAAGKVTSFRERQVVAIMPRVGPPPPLPQNNGIQQVSRGRAGAAHLHTGPQLVETHTAMIAFQANDLISVNGWEVKNLDDDFRYIALNGEQLSFVANGVNPRVNTNLRLGHVPGAALRPEFKHPYTGAAAVVSIPNGTIGSCKSSLAVGRMDTQLWLDNKGTLTIQGGGKSLTVDGNAAVVIANVPMLWATDHAASGIGAEHFHAYCAMTNTFPCDFNTMKPPSDQAIPLCASNLMKVIPNSNTPVPTPKRIVPASIASIDVFCSNTQWP